MRARFTAGGLAWITRNFHELPGRWRLVRWLENHAQLVAAVPPTTVRFGLRQRIRVNPRDENGRHVLIHGFDPRERLTRHFIRLLRPGDCVLDVGANMGYYTLTAANLVGPEGCVHAFEPAPAVLPWLRANVSLNPKATIRIHPVAVTDHRGEQAFYSAAPTCTGYSSLRDLGSAASAVNSVECLDLDSLMPSLSPVRLVKIDVEGAELGVLRGASRLFHRDHPFIITEMDDTFLRQCGDSAAEMCAHLRAAGYDLHQIVEKGRLRPVEDIPTQRCNLLASPRTPEGLAASRA